jgi:hypothetical protein
MKAKYILSFSIITLIEGILVLFALMAMNFTPDRGGIINYVTLRWILAGSVLLVLTALTLFVIGLLNKPGWGALGLVSFHALAHGSSFQDRQA